MATTPNIPPPPSGSTVMIPPPPSGSIVHLGAGGQQQAPQPQQQPSAQPAAPSADDIRTHLTDNPNKEGLYRFVDVSKVNLPDNATKEQAQAALNNAPVLYVPYSKALALLNHPERVSNTGPGEVKVYQQGAEDAMDKYGLALHPDEVKRLYNDYLNDPRLHDLRMKNGFDTTFPVEVGAVRGAAKTGAGLSTIARKATGTQPTKAEQTVKNFADTPNANSMETLGEAGENMGEFMSGEEILGAIGKVLGPGAKLADAAKIESEIEKGTTMGKLFLTALRQGTVAGGQGYVKTGGDTGEAASDFALNAGLGLGIGIPSELLGRGTDSLLAAAAEHGTATPEQGAMQEQFRNMAKEAIRPHLEAINETRGNYSQLQLPHRTGPYEFSIGGPAPTEGTEGTMAQSAAKAPRHAFEQPQYTTSSAPTRTPGGNEGTMGADITTGRTPEPAHDVARGGGVMKTTDVNQAIRYRDSLQAALDSGAPAKQQAGIKAELARINGQIEEYRGLNRDYSRSPQPKLNVGEILDNTNSFAQARDHLNDAGHSIYQRIDDATGGDFLKTKAALNNAEAESTQAALQQKLDRMVEDAHSSGAVSRQEYTAAKDALRKGYVLNDLARSFDNAWMGNPGSGKIGNSYNGLNGKSLLTAIRNARTKYGDVQLSEILGSDRLVNMEQQAALNVTQSQRQQYGLALNKVAQWVEEKNPGMMAHFGAMGVGGLAAHVTGMPWYTGAAAGLGTEMGVKKIAQIVMSNPKIGENLAFALRSGARPENYVPMIGSMIREASDTAARKNEQEEKGEQQ